MIFLIGKKDRMNDQFITCNHRWKLIEGMRDSSGEHYHVSICVWCGRFRVFGHAGTDGHFDISFFLPTEELADAARIFVNEEKAKQRGY